MKTRLLLLLPLLSVALQACHYPPQAAGRCYGVNYNFVCISDSMTLQAGRPLHNQPVDTSFQPVIFRGDELVVAAFAIIPEDSIDSVWVKVAHDQLTQGWVHEQDLLTHVVPNDPISQSIYFFSQRHLVVFLIFVGCLAVVQLLWRNRHSQLHLPHYHDIPSVYPTASALLFFSAVLLYGSIQQYVPQTWEVFYFHPTLNPFGLPLILSLFLSAVWLALVCLVAAADDVLSMLPPIQAIRYGVSLVGLFMVGYLLLSLTSRIELNYVLFIIYAVWAVCRYVRHFAPHCRCGRCGAKMHGPGKCTRCGTENTAVPPTSLRTLKDQHSRL